MKSNLLIAALAASLFTACAGPGEVKKIQITMTDTDPDLTEMATIVAHDQKVPDWMLAKDKLAMNYIVKGEVSDKQLKAIAETERACRIYTDTVRPSNLVAVLSGGALYALAGGIGVGMGSQAFTGAVQSQYQYYGAMASGTGGTANGVITLGGQTYTFDNCAQNVVSIFPRIFPGSTFKVLTKGSS